VLRVDQGHNGHANTGGGYIVIGVSEAETEFRLEGLAPDQAGTFESSQICRFVQNYADPPVNVRVMKVTVQGLVLVVLEIPDSLILHTYVRRLFQMCSGKENCV